MSGSTNRIRVPANHRPMADSKSFMTADGFQNFAAQLGYGLDNQSSGNSYGFNPITRNHTKLEWMYRGSWLVRQIVDAPADDMTRAGVQIESDMSPDDMELLNQHMQEQMVWQRMNAGIKWSRLYGGALVLMMIEGQRTDTPLNTETIMEGQFKGLVVLDRWMVWPDLTETVTEPGPDFGQPKYYQIVADVRGMPKLRLHHTRVIRLDGVELPYWQTISENGWSLSVIEPLLDRMVAFDSVTQGAAQLAFKAHLRVMRVDGLRELIAAGGGVYTAFLQQMAIIRLMQTNEGMTVIDKEDEFQTNTYSFAGLSDLLIQFGQQLSGASQIPLTRLFGQSPAGMNSTGESDLRNYYDSIKAQQEARLRRAMTVLFDIMCRSLFGKPLPKGFSYSFTPLWQLSETEKATIAGQVATFIDQAKMGGLIGSELALKELKQASKLTGYFSNISDEDIKKAAEDDLLPPPMPDAGDDAQPGQPGQPPPKAPAKPATAPEDKADAKADKESESDDSAEPARKPRKGNKMVAKMFPNSKGLTFKDLPPYAQPLMSKKSHVQQKYGHLANGHSIADVRGLYPAPTHDTDSVYPLRDFQGLNVVIETLKGQRRTGYGWAAIMGADYGYISGTSSAEGGTEQMDCFCGDDYDSTKVYIIEQINPMTKQFDESKIMLGFNSKDAATQAYVASFSDDSGKKRIGRVMTTNVESVKSWLATRWQYDTRKPADHSGAHATP